MKIKGEKIYLKKGLVEGNYPLLLAWFHDLEIMQYVGWVKTGLALKNIQELKSFISELENGIIFGIYTNEGNFIGYASLSDFISQEECEFGIFILDKNFQGKGVGKEVTRLLLNYGFNELNMKKIILSTSEFHENAISLYEKMGFKKIRIVPDDREIFHNGHWVLSGTVEMEIKQEDFSLN
jgi:RimJ/RimL family protein N-acetyltransferase